MVDESKPERIISFTGHATITENLHLSGGVSVIVCAVNSSSKYRVSISDVTCGLKSGVSWHGKEKSLEN